MGDSTALPHPSLPPPGRPKTFSRGQVCHRRAALSASILFLNNNVLQMILTRNALPSGEIRRPSRALAFTREPHVIHGETLWENLSVLCDFFNMEAPDHRLELNSIFHWPYALEYCVTLFSSPHQNRLRAPPPRPRRYPPVISAQYALIAP